MFNSVEELKRKDQEREERCQKSFQKKMMDRDLKLKKIVVEYHEKIND